MGFGRGVGDGPCGLREWDQHWTDHDVDPFRMRLVLLATLGLLGATGLLACPCARLPARLPARALACPCAARATACMCSKQSATHVLRGRNMPRAPAAARDVTDTMLRALAHVQQLQVSELTRGLYCGGAKPSLGF